MKYEDNYNNVWSSILFCFRHCYLISSTNNCFNLDNTNYSNYFNHNNNFFIYFINFYFKRICYQQPK